MLVGVNERHDPYHGCNEPAQQCGIVSSYCSHASIEYHLHAQVIPLLRLIQQPNQYHHQTSTNIIKLQTYPAFMNNPQTSTKIHRHLITFLICFLLLELVLGYFMRQSLYFLGLDFIIAWSGSQSFLSYLVWNAITLLSEPVVVSVGLFVLLLGDKRKERVFRVVSYALINVYIITVLKAAFKDPRPFWSTNLILQKQLLSCPREYGNPSGHSWFATLAVNLWLWEYTSWKSSCKGIAVAIAIMVLVPCSRMALGAHSLDQVVFGVLGGITMVAAYLVGAKQKVMEMLEQFNIAPIGGWKMYVLILNIVNFVPYFFTFYPHSPQIQSLWETNIALNPLCPPPALNLLPFSLLMAASLILQLISGLAEGYASMTHTDRGRHYLTGKWTINQHKYTMFLGNLLYYLTQIGILIITIPIIGIALYFFGENVWVSYVILNIGLYLIGYLYSSKTCEVLYKNGIIRQIL